MQSSQSSKRQSSQHNSQKGAAKDSKEPQAPAKAKRESSTGAKEPKSGAGKAQVKAPVEEQKRPAKTTEKAVTRQGNAAASPNDRMKLKQQAQKSAPSGPSNLGNPTTAVKKAQQEIAVPPKKSVSDKKTPLREKSLSKPSARGQSQDQKPKRGASPAKAKMGRKTEKPKQEDSDSDSDNTASIDLKKPKGRGKKPAAKPASRRSSSDSSSSDEKNASLKGSVQSSSNSSSDEDMKEEEKVPLKNQRGKGKKQIEADEKKKTLYSRVIKADQREKRLSLKFTRDLDADCPENNVCHVCFQAAKMPILQNTKMEVDEGSKAEPSDIQMLYQMIFCKTCFTPAHWSCIGTDREVFEYGKTADKMHYLFECDKCKYKHAQSQNPQSIKLNFGIMGASNQPQCIACEKDGGILQAFEVSGDADNISDAKFFAFCHPICAWTLKDHFKFTANQDAIKFSLKDSSLKNPLIAAKKEKVKKGKPCALCKSTSGLMVENEELSDQAHPFCIVNAQYKKEDGYDAYVWSIQGLFNSDDEFKPFIKVKSQGVLSYCACGIKDYGDMAQCDGCRIWYHISCDTEFVNGDSPFLCINCCAWRIHLEKNILKILFNRPKFQDLLNDEGTYWEGFDSLCNYVEDSDRAMETPMKIIEHQILVKAWSVLLELMKNEVVQESHLVYHIQEAQYLFPHIDTSEAQQDLQRRKSKIEKIIEDHCEELTLKDIPTPNMQGEQNLSQAQQQSAEALIKHNKLAAIKVDELIETCKKEAKMINSSVDDLIKIKQKSQVLQSAFQLLTSTHKPLLEKVRPLCEKIEELEMGDEGYQSINTIMSMMQEYIELDRAQFEKAGKKGPQEHEEKIKERLNVIKSNKEGLKRQEAKYRLFKEYLNSKPNLDEAKGIIDKSAGLRVDVSTDRLFLDQLVGIIEKLERSYDQILTNPQQVKNPSLRAQEILIESCCFPFKSPKVDEVFETWNKSMIWKTKAQNFLQTKLTPEQLEEVKGFEMEVDEGSGKNVFRENDYIWTLSRAQELLKEIQEAEATKRPYFIDLKLHSQFKEKVHTIESLKACVTEALGLSKNKDDINLLRKYMIEMEAMQTVDFQSEISMVKEKIKLSGELRRIADNDQRIKYSIEQLSKINQTIERLENPKGEGQIVIRIEENLKAALQTKLEVARQCKNEIQDIMKTQYQNTFNKNMVSQLKGIVNRAEQEYGIDMKDEQRIIDNIPYSEEWFMQTYDKLKSVVGKALHQVDFKNFVQLSQVLTEEKDCVQLLKGLQKSHKSLEGAAINLWRAIAGVKWVFEAKRLLNMSVGSIAPPQAEEIELKKVIELDNRARDDLEIDYDQEIGKGHMYSQLFKEFKLIVDCIEMFKKRFGSYQKLVQTLEHNLGRLQDFEKECEDLTQVLQSHKITSQSGELDLLSKIHTYVDFLKQYLELTQESEQSKKMLDYEKACLLQEQAREHNIPADLSILRDLNESVARFQKFQREYSDYKRYRERILKKKQGEGVPQVLLETRFTCQFVKRLIDEYGTLRIAHALPPAGEVKGEEDDLYFNKEMLQRDLSEQAVIRGEAEAVLNMLEDDELAIQNDKDLIVEFERIKQSMALIPLYDKEIALRMQVFEWLFHCNQLLNRSSEDDASLSMNILGWETKLVQAEKLIEQLQSFYQLLVQQSHQSVTQQATTSHIGALLRNLKKHSIYQRVIWEIDQAKGVIEFVTTNKTNSKAAASKYNYNDLLKQQSFHVHTFFRNKQNRAKVEKMLYQAKKSKVILTDEVRVLENWLRDYDLYKGQFEQGVLHTENTFERLREIAKTIYISPIDMSDVYLKLKPKLEIAEALKLDLKQIVQEHEFAQLQRQAQGQEDGIARPYKRLRYSRISDSLAIFEKDCKIPGIKEIDSLLAKYRSSVEKLTEAEKMLANIPKETDQLVQHIDKAKKLLLEMEIDMEREEINVKRQIFELEMRHILLAHLLSEPPKEHPLRRIDLDEFKVIYEKDFDQLVNHLKDEQVHALFLEMKNKVNDALRAINKVETKTELQQLKEALEKDLPLIDFTQTLTDVDASLVLGKRQYIQFRKASSSSMESYLNKESSSSEESKSEQGNDASSQNEKRRKLNTGEAVVVLKQQKKQASKSSSSSSEDSGSDESSSESESEQYESVKKGGLSKPINIAKDRERRTIQPKLDEDFIYDNPSVKAQRLLAKKKQEEAKKKPAPKQESESSSSDSDEEGSQSSSGSEESSSSSSEEDNRRKKAGLLEKKRQIKQKFVEHNKSKSSVLPQRYPVDMHDRNDQFAKPAESGEMMVGIGQTLGDQIQKDKAIQNTLQAFKQQKRLDAKKKLKAVIEDKSTLFSTLSPNDQALLMNDFEEEVYKKHPETDMYYNKRINSICENIRFLKDFADIQKIFVQKRSLSMGKLLQNHMAFKDDMIKMNEQIKEKKRLIKELSVQQPKPAPPKVEPAARQIPEQPVLLVKPEEVKTPKPYDPMSDDDRMSCESNPALFSDDEDDAGKKNPVQMMETIMKQNEGGMRSAKPPPIDPNFIKRQHQQAQYQQQYFQGQPQPQYTSQALTLAYNPFEVFEQKHLGIGPNGAFKRFVPHKPSEAVLYDPFKAKQASGGVKKAPVSAPVGSLLRVWEGQLELTKDSSVRCTLFSSIDIETFFQLPEMPSYLALKGKAKLQDVTTHFLRLKKERRLLKGWIARKGSLQQDNSDKYVKLFDELDQTGKSALFNVFTNITLYIVPITAKTRDFCNEMGVNPEEGFRKEELFEKVQTNEERDKDDVRNLEEETHLYAFFSQIKTSFDQKSSVLVPDVIKQAIPRAVVQPMEQKHYKHQNPADTFYNPLSPVGMSESKRPPVKQEESYHMPPTNMRGKDPRLAYMQAPPQIKHNDESYMQHAPPVMKQEPETNFNVDELIQGFKNQDYNLQTIQDKLLSIIHLVSGEDEQKLTDFLQELIHNLNGGETSRMAETETKQETTNLGYIYPANLGQIPQYQQYPMQGGPVYGGQAPYMQHQQFRPPQQYGAQPQFTNQGIRPPQGLPPQGGQFYGQPSMGVMYPVHSAFPGQGGPQEMMMGGMHPNAGSIIRPPPSMQQQPAIRPPYQQNPYQQNPQDRR